MSTSTASSRSDGSVELRGFTKRASKVVSNGALFDLVQDMAMIVDQVPPRLDRIEEKVDLIVSMLGEHFGKELHSKSD